MDLHLLTSLRELHSRVNDGIHVRLLWSKEHDHTTVAVLDTTTGDAFHVDVRAGESALDVFHHPFAYAACRGIPVASSPVAA